MFLFSTRYLEFCTFFTFYNQGDSDLFVSTVPEPYFIKVGMIVNVYSRLLLCFCLSAGGIILKL